jgi:hypothetical protein
MEMRSGPRGSTAQNAGKARKKYGEAHVSELLEKWLKSNRASERLEKGNCFSLWKEVVGEDLAQSTRVVEVRNGEMIVEVNSAPLLNELSTYFREEILDALREREEFRGVHKLRFRAGSF